VLKCLESANLLRPGSRGLGFGCGEEPFASAFAARGVEVVVTDLDPRSQAATGWVQNNQHASSAEKVYREELVSRAKFDSLVTFQYLDMNRIPLELSEQFDFCWSVCAMEHLGSIDLGSKFVENSMAVLKPGGFAVHTTEFNYSSNDDTIENGGTVLYRKRDIEALAQRMRQLGHFVYPVSFEVGSTPVDWFIDVPPYPGDAGFLDGNLKALHLKLMIEGFPCTCYGMVIRRPVILS
jgi:SAM-dependent methyltransferase